ncbi:Txe/YoeB family addiction module toxin [Bifidobacterium pseudolongum]|uniref:Txe/YoeB family addiction module toxin n=1 Tax=Bifidobacterium pseudolongum TaxID=1694 RepID=UPI003BF46A13
MLADIMRNPFESTGKPEPLQWDFAGAWSRRISEKHRIIYMPMADVIAITSC